MVRNQQTVRMLIIGYTSLVICVVGLWIIFNPILFANSLIMVKKINYLFAKKEKDVKPQIVVLSKPVTTPVPVDSATLPFSLTIPKIDLEAKVVPNVDASNPDIYKAALKEGVAQAKGTAFPGQGKMIYIFGHSTDYAWNVSTYNALFYQVKDLTTGDLVVARLGDKNYDYTVIDRQIVAPTDMSLIEKHANDDVLILQTCYPPGTTWKRLLVVASPKSSFSSLISYK